MTRKMEKVSVKYTAKCSQAHGLPITGNEPGQVLYAGGHSLAWRILRRLEMTSMTRSRSTGERGGARVLVSARHRRERGEKRDRRTRSSSNRLCVTFHARQWSRHSVQGQLGLETPAVGTRDPSPTVYSTALCIYLSKTSWCYDRETLRMAYS